MVVYSVYAIICGVCIACTVCSFPQVLKTTSGSTKLSVSLSLVKRIGLDGECTQYLILCAGRDGCDSWSLCLAGSDGLKVTATKKAANRGWAPSCPHGDEERGELAILVHILFLSTETVVLEAFLCRLGSVEGVREGFTSLPLLLSRGPRSLSSELQQWLQSSFDCHVAPHPLHPDDLCLLVGEFATAEKSMSVCLPLYVSVSLPPSPSLPPSLQPSHSSTCCTSCLTRHVHFALLSASGGRGLGGVELVYSAPPPVASQGLSTVSVALPYESVVSVWERAGTSATERQQGEWSTAILAV